MNGFRHQFSAGLRPLAGAFRSLYLLPNASTDGCDFSMPAAALADWIGRWDSWYLARLRDADGGLTVNRHLLYEREVALTVPPMAPTHRNSCIAPIAARCRELGLGFALELPVRDDGDLVALGELISSVVPWRTTLTLPAAGAPISAEIWHQTLDTLARARRNLHVAGPLDLIRSLATTSSAPLNAQAHSYGPTAATAVARVAEPGCGLRFGVFVAGDGGIYPCRALIGLAALRLGSIFDEMEDTALGGAPHVLDLASLAHNGPGCDQAPSDEAGSREPRICIRHRRFLERLHRRGSSESQGSNRGHSRAT